MVASAQDEMLPAHWFEEVSCENGSHQQCLVFDTVPGVFYTVRFSQNLSNWSNVAEVYGIGQNFVTTMREIEPPPEPMPGQPAPEALTNPSFYISLILCRSSTPGGGTVVSWRSLDHGGDVTYEIPGTLVQDWDWVPLFAKRYGDFEFFITHRPASIPSPADNPSLGPEDFALIETLSQNLSAMNLEVVNSTYQARNSPPAPPAAPDAKGFWRIEAD